MVHTFLGSLDLDLEPSSFENTGSPSFQGALRMQSYDLGCEKIC